MECTFRTTLGASGLALSEIILIFTIACLILLSIGCSSVTKKGNADVSYNSEEGTIKVTLNNIATCNYSIKINDKTIVSDVITEEVTINILYILKDKLDVDKDVAMFATKNNNDLLVKLNLTNLLDTSFVYHLTPAVSLQDDNVQFIGSGAKVVSKSSSSNIDEELKRWLYRNRELVNDSIFKLFRTNYLYMIGNKNEYVVQGEIPVLHNLSGSKYSVSCSMKADYYAILACRGQNFIDIFVENSVVKDFQNLSTSKTNIPCVTVNNDSGYFCLVLLGINKDFSYQQIPFAVVAVDNSAPSEVEPSGNLSVYDFRNGEKVILPANVTQIFGNATVRVLHWDGNGLECNVTFLVNFAGDAKSVTIHRRGELCYPNQYLGNHFPVEDKILYAKNGYEQRLTWKMHFDSGDNEIPITVEDYHGNKRDFNVIVRAEFVRSNSPQIDIDNNIDIYN